jgi:hypothetical protein
MSVQGRRKTVCSIVGFGTIYSFKYLFYLQLLLLLLTIFHVNFSYGSSSGSSSSYLCGPLLADPVKVRTLRRYHDGRVPLLFWHIQKAGGTSFCQMMINEMNARNQSASDGDNCNGPWQELVNTSTVRRPATAGLGFSMEPAYTLGESFPEEYYSIMEDVLANRYQLAVNKPSFQYMYNIFGTTKSKSETKNKIKNKNNSLKQNQYITGHPFWTKLPHVLAVREPFSMALSAFTYHFANTRQSVLGSCLKRKLTVDECMQNAFEVVDGIDDHKEIWGNYQRTKIKTHTHGNFLLLHLSANGDIEEAKANLRRFTVIFDLSHEELSTHLLLCTLGWTHVTEIPKVNTHRQNVKNTRRRPPPPVLRRITNETLWRWRTYLMKDQELYQYAVSLIRAHHTNATTYHSETNMHMLENDMSESIEEAQKENIEAINDPTAIRWLTLLSVIIAILLYKRLKSA